MGKAYTIYIRDYRGGEGSRQRSTATTATGETVGGNTDRRKETKSTEEKVMLAAFHYAKQYARMAANYEISMIETRTGNAKMQQNVQFGYDILSKTLSIGESVAAGFLVTGGNPVGAVVGATLAIANQGIQLAMASEKMAAAQSLESITLAQNAIRIGASGNRTGATR